MAARFHFVLMFLFSISPSSSFLVFSNFLCLSQKTCSISPEDSVRSPPNHTGRRTPHTTSYTASLPVQKGPTRSVTMRAHIRQNDPSLSFGWHDDPPQEIRASLHSGSSLCGVSCCHLPSVPYCLTTPELPRPIWRHALLVVNRSHIPRRSCSTPKAAHNYPREDFWSISALHFTSFTSFFTLLYSPSIVAIPAKVFRVRYASFH